MATVTTRFGAGGAGLQPGGSNGETDLAAVLRDVIDDLNDLRSKHNALLAKLDADGGVTDTNYAALHTVAAIKSIKG